MRLVSFPVVGSVKPLDPFLSSPNRLFGLSPFDLRLSSLSLLVYYVATFPADHEDLTHGDPPPFMPHLFLLSTLYIS